MSSIEAKKNRDSKEILEFIENHSNKDGIISMFLKGPPTGEGFTWCSTEGGQGFHWSDAEADGLKTIRGIVLDKGWASGGYGFMMRYIQSEIRKSAIGTPFHWSVSSSKNY